MSNEIPLCPDCGSVMDGPATGIGYWCPNMKCGSDELLKLREEFKSHPIKYTKSDLAAKQVELLREITESINNMYTETVNLAYPVNGENQADVVYKTEVVEVIQAKINKLEGK